MGDAEKEPLRLTPGTIELAARGLGAGRRPARSGEELLRRQPLGEPLVLCEQFPQGRPRLGRQRRRRLAEWLVELALEPRDQLVVFDARRDWDVEVPRRTVHQVPAQMPEHWHPCQRPALQHDRHRRHVPLGQPRRLLTQARRDESPTFRQPRPVLAARVAAGLRWKPVAVRPARVVGCGVGRSQCLAVRSLSVAACRSWLAHGEHLCGVELRRTDVARRALHSCIDTYSTT